MASWRSAGAEWTEVFESRVVFEAAETQLRAIAHYDPPGGTSVGEFFQHMLQLGDCVWELRNRQLEQLLRAPHRAAARVHPWLTAAESDCPPAPPQPGRDNPAPLCLVNGTPKCPPQEDPHPYRDLPGGFLEHLRGLLFPPRIIGRNSRTTWEVHIVSAEQAREWSWWSATMRALETPTPQYAAIPLECLGPHTRPRPTVTRGPDAERLWDAATTEWLQAAPKPHTGWRGDVSSLLLPPLPPHFLLHAANMLRAMEIHTWGRNAANVRWLPPEDGGTRLKVAHFTKGGPMYDDALSRLGNIAGPLLLMLPTNLAAALRRELDHCGPPRVGWETVGDGTVLVHLHQGTADGCRWVALMPHLTGRHTYMTTLQEELLPAWNDLMAVFHDHRILPNDTWPAIWHKMLRRDYRLPIRTRLLELRGPLRQQWDDFGLRRLDPWFPASHLPHTYHHFESATRCPLPR